MTHSDNDNKAARQRRPADNDAARAMLRLRPATLAALTSLFWLLSANAPFLTAGLQGRPLASPGTWGLLLALAVGVWAIHLVMLAPFAWPRVVKPAVVLLSFATAIAAFYVQRYNVYLDPSMMRNVLRTTPGETAELLGPGLVLHVLLFAGLPALLAWRVRIVPQPWTRSLRDQVLLAGTALLVLVLAVVAAFQPLSSLMRNHKELRYRITPANVLWSTSVVLAGDARTATQEREVIGADARPGDAWAQRRKPLVVVLVVGETARAANWGLSGYARNTTPELAGLPVINFPSATSCGTNTETSVPCMFAPVGRRDHDEARIRRQQSLLHVAARAGVQVHWRDNQSGCKGVCEGLPSESARDAPSVQKVPALCPGGVCWDEALVHDLGERLQAASGTQLWVLHMLGSHGPSYSKRYPKAFAAFEPACAQDDLSRCTVAEIVNAYDNTIRYTDHVLATAIRTLTAAQDRVDSALYYVSDHGESLGERGLFLHGIPYAIAPDVQLQVPMVMWLSPGLESAIGARPGCLAPALAARARQPVSHDHLFHTVLGLLDVHTRLRDRSLDLTQACRPGADASPR